MCRADEQEWSFDSKQFEARLFQDWLAQDVSDPALRGVIFTDAADFDAQRECVSKVLASLSDDPSEDEFDDALPYDVATGAEGEVPREKDVDPSSEGVEKLNVRFNALVAEKVKCGDPQWRELYRDACLARRARRLASAVEYAPKIVYTFFESVDMNGKTIIPFCTSGGSPVGDSANHLHEFAPEANWKDGTRFELEVSKEEIAEWLKED